jgi:hypothetical protein
VKDGFTLVKGIEDIPLKEYAKIAVSGGEPLLLGRALDDILLYIKRKTRKLAVDYDTRSAEIFLYTNGVLLDDDVTHRFLRRNLVDGFNIGIHEVNWPEIIRLSKLETNMVRFLMMDTAEFDPVEGYLTALGRTVRRFKLNECDKPEEDWYTLEAL